MLSSREVQGEVLISEPRYEQAQALADLYRRVWNSKYPNTKFLDAQGIASEIAQGEHVWYIAHQGNEIVGSTVGVFEQEGSTVEIGRGVVDKRFNGLGIGRKLCEKVREGVIQKGGEVLWGSLRNAAMYRIGGHIHLDTVGYSEFYVVDEREMQIVGVEVTRAAREKRVTSPRGDFYQLPSIERIMQQFDLGEDVGEYPPEVIVNFNAGEKVHPACSVHAANSALILDSLPSDPDQLPEYIEATLLIDKTEHIRYLQKFGFAITAFLPAWYEKEYRRYDCLLLSNSVSAAIADPALLPVIEELKNGFRSGR